MKQLVIIGGRSTGVEFAKKIAKRNVEEHIVEKMDHLLATVFDPEIYLPVEEYLAVKGIQLHGARSSRPGSLSARHAGKS